MDDYVCEQCGRHFKNKRGLSVHKRYCKPSPPEADTEEPTTFTKETPTQGATEEDTAELSEGKAEEPVEQATEVSGTTSPSPVDLGTAIASAMENALSSMFGQVINRLEEIEHRVEEASEKSGVSAETADHIVSLSIHDETLDENDEGDVTVESVPVEQGEGHKDTDMLPREDIEEYIGLTTQSISERFSEIDSRIEQLENLILKLQHTVEAWPAPAFEERVAVVEREVKDLHQYHMEIEELQNNLHALEESVKVLKETMKEYLETYEFFDLSKIPPQILKNVYEVTLNDIVKHLFSSYGEADTESIVLNVLEDVRGRTTGSELFRYANRRFSTPELVHTINSSLLTVRVIHMTYEQIVKRLLEYLPSYKLPAFNNIIRVKSQEYAIDKATRGEREIRELWDVVEALSTETERQSAEIESLKQTVMQLMDDNLELQTKLKTTLARINTELDARNRKEEEASEEKAVEEESSTETGEEEEESIAPVVEEPGLPKEEEPSAPELPVEEPLEKATGEEPPREFTEPHEKESSSMPGEGVLVIGDDEEEEEKAVEEEEADYTDLLWTGGSEEEEVTVEGGEEEEYIVPVEGGVISLGEDEQEEREIEPEVPIELVEKDGVIEVVEDTVGGVEAAGDVITVEKDGTIIIEEREPVPPRSKKKKTQRKPKSRKKEKKKDKEWADDGVEEVKEILIGRILLENGGYVSIGNLRKSVRDSGITGRGTYGLIDTALEQLIDEGKIEMDPKKKRYRIKI